MVIINVSPSAMADKAWHAHILNTPMYMEFTKAEFDHYAHHILYRVDHGTDEDVYIHLTQYFAIITCRNFHSIS
jgi:hypothetical protein